MTDVWSGKIFISYRRKDTSHLAGRLQERISLRFPASHIFIDSKIPYGDDFPVYIDKSVRDSDVLLVVIGRNWNTMDRGAESTDYYVLEIRTALERKIPIIPILADGAIMPEEKELPPEISALASRHGLQIAHETFDSDASTLLESIARIPVRTVPTWFESLVTRSRNLARQLGRGISLKRAVAALVVGTIVAVAFFFIRGIGAPAGSAGCGAGGPPPAGGDLRVGVIFPELVYSDRWECFDRPLLDKAMREYGLTPDIRNAQGNVQKFTAIAEEMINNDAKVLVINSPTNDAGIAVARRAQIAGIPVIDYDRLTVGGSSEYHVTFDYMQIGELQAESLVQGVGDKASADIIVVGGAPGDYNATLIGAGQNNILQPRYASGAYRLAASKRIQDWNPLLGETFFADALADNGGRVDGVLAANDAMAAAVINVLKRNGLSGKVPVTGLDATPASLRAILRGEQYMTVFKPIADQAVATARLASALARGDRTEADRLAPSFTADPDSRRGVKSILLTPVLVTKQNIKRVVDDGFVRAADVCTEDVVTYCQTAGIR